MEGATASSRKRARTVTEPTDAIDFVAVYIKTKWGEDFLLFSMIRVNRKLAGMFEETLTRFKRLFPAAIDWFNRFITNEHVVRLAEGPDGEMDWLPCFASDQIFVVKVDKDLRRKRPACEKNTWTAILLTYLADGSCRSLILRLDFDLRALMFNLNDTCKIPLVVLDLLHYSENCENYDQLGNLLFDFRFNLQPEPKLWSSYYNNVGDGGAFLPEIYEIETVGDLYALITSGSFRMELNFPPALAEVVSDEE